MPGEYEFGRTPEINAALGSILGAYENIISVPVPVPNYPASIPTLVTSKAMNEMQMDILLTLAGAIAQTIDDLSSPRAIAYANAAATLALNHFIPEEVAQAINILLMVEMNHMKDNIEGLNEKRELEVARTDNEIEASQPAGFSVGLISNPAFAVNGGAPTSGPTQVNALGQTISNYSGLPAFTAPGGVITMTGKDDGSGPNGPGATPGGGPGNTEGGANPGTGQSP